MTKAADTLRAAKALIQDEARWVTGNYAVTDNGNAIGAYSPNACRFCAVGALANVSGMSPREVELEDKFLPGVFLNRAAKELGRWSPHVINDEWGHAKVMEMYDLAISMAESSGVSRPLPTSTGE